MAKSTKAAARTAAASSETGTGSAGVAAAAASTGAAASNSPATGPLTLDNIESRLSNLLQADDTPAAETVAVEPTAAGGEPGNEPTPGTEGAAAETTETETGETETIPGEGETIPGEGETPPEEVEPDPALTEKVQKRIDKLTAEKYELKEQLEGMQTQLTELQAKLEDKPAATPAARGVNPLANVKSEAELQAKEQEAESLLDWVEEQLVVLQDDPDQVAVALRQQKVGLKDAEGNEDYSPGKMARYLMEVRRNLDKTVRTYIPQRRVHLQAVTHCDKFASQHFPFVTDRKAPEHAIVQEVIQSMPGIQGRPDWKIFVGVHALGLMALRERGKSPKNGSAAPKPPPRAPRVPGSVHIPPTADTGKVKVEQAREKMLKGGDPDDYIKLALGQVAG